MKCKCGGKLQVIGTFPQTKGIRRRKRCKRCDQRIWTYECLEGQLHPNTAKLVRELIKQLSIE